MTALKDDPEVYKELIIPNHFFCTFMSGEGKSLAQKRKKFK